MAAKDLFNVSGKSPQELGRQLLGLFADGANVEKALALIEAGAAVNEKDAWGNTSLMLAVAYRRTPCVKALIAARAWLDVKDEDGWTPLIMAVQRGYEDCVRVLVEAGASLDEKSSVGNTALMIAISKGSLACVKSLVEAGASVDNALLRAEKHPDRPEIIQVVKEAAERQRKLLAEKAMHKTAATKQESLRRRMRHHNVKS